MLLTIKFLPFLASTSYFLYKFPNTTDEEEKNFEYSSHKFLNLLLLPMFMIIENGLVDLLSNPTYAFVYKRKILFGLIISAVADILIIHDFMVGLVLFALVHMLYISALGFKPLKPALGLVCLLIQSGFSIFFLNHFTDKLLQIAAPLYGLLLLCMVWRACSKLDYNVLRVLLALGSIAFATSDILLCFEKFVWHVPNSGFIILITYYFAQLTITMSTIEFDYVKQQNNAKLD